jgi:nitroreductase
MEFLEVVRRRRMVRLYDPARQLPDGLLDQMVDVALRAPTAGFTQGVSFLILQLPADLDLFWTATVDPDAGTDSWLAGMRTAPGLILVLSSAEAYLDRYALADKGWTDRSTEPWTAPYWFVDAGMAGLAALYAAVDADSDGRLGACFFGVPADRIGAVRAAFGIPEQQYLVGVISVGYRAEGERQSGSPRTRPRKPRAALVHHGRWSETSNGPES